MTWCPFAHRREMPYNHTLPARQHSPTVVLHTNAGGTGTHGDLYDWFSRKGNDICSHFQVAWDGTIYQYVDTDRQAYAQYSGNPFAVSIETQDDGNPSKPWTDAQVDAIVRLAEWLHVPARLAPDSPSGGVGYHSQLADWNKSHHDCPGKVRVHQISTDVLPKLKAGVPEVITDTDVDRIANAVFVKICEADTLPAPDEAPTAGTNKTWSRDNALRKAVDMLYEIKKKVGA